MKKILSVIIAAVVLCGCAGHTHESADIHEEHGHVHAHSYTAYTHNAEFFLQRSTARMALKMLKEDNIHLLGSDCHDLESRAPNLGAACQRIRKALGEEALERICSYEDMILRWGDEK